MSAQPLGGAARTLDEEIQQAWAGRLIGPPVSLIPGRTSPPPLPSQAPSRASSPQSFATVLGDFGEPEPDDYENVPLVGEPTYRTQGGGGGGGGGGRGRGRGRRGEREKEEEEGGGIHLPKIVEDRNYELDLSDEDRECMVRFLSVYAGQLTYGASLLSVFNSTITQKNVERLLDDSPLVAGPQLKMAKIGDKHRSTPWKYISKRCKPPVVSAVERTFAYYVQRCWPKPTIDELIRNRDCVVPFALVCADSARRSTTGNHNGVDSRRLVAMVQIGNEDVSAMVQALRTAGYVTHSRKQSLSSSLGFLRDG